MQETGNIKKSLEIELWKFSILQTEPNSELMKHVYKGPTQNQTTKDILSFKHFYHIVFDKVQ